jgi:hypothetical protein
MTPTASTPALVIYIYGYSYKPFSNCEVEIDHTLAGGGVARYSIGSIQHSGIQITNNGVNQDVLELNISTGGGSSSTTAGGLQYALYDGQLVTIRVLQNVKLANVATVHPARPSTSLQYSTNLNTVYRILSYSLAESTGENLSSTTQAAQGFVLSAGTNTAVVKLAMLAGNTASGVGIGQLVQGVGLNGTFNTYAYNVLSSGISTTATGSSGGSTLTVNSAANIVAGMLVQGTGVPYSIVTNTYTFVASSYVPGSTTVPLANISGTSVNLTTNASGSYTFGGVVSITLNAPPSTYTAGLLIYTLYNVTQSTSIVQTDSSFNYYQVSTDTASVGLADPTPLTTGYASATVVSWTPGTSTLVINSVSGAITSGMAIGGIGFTGQSVNTVSGSGTVTVTITGTPSTTVPPQPGAGVWFSTQTLGSRLGDSKIAVTAITNTATVTQLNLQQYITSLNGRTHRIISYVPPTSYATATYSSGGTSGSTTIQVSGLSGTVTVGMIVYNSTGFTSGQTVTVAPVYNINTGYYAISVSASANAGTPANTIYFANASVSSTVAAYIVTDPNPVTNNAAISTSAPTALTLASVQYNVNSTGFEYVTYNVPNTQTVANPIPVLPAVDSYLTISGQNSIGSAFNGTYPIQQSLNQTTITVGSTTNLQIGMYIATTATGAIIPPNCMVQSISSDGITFVVSPAAWIPVGATITANFLTSVASVTIVSGGGGEYTTVPSLTFSGGSPTVSAQATATIANGYITNVNITVNGSGYTNSPPVTLSASYGTAQFSVVLSSTTAYSGTVATVTPTTQVTVVYPTQIGTATGTVASLTFSGNVITISSSTGTLTPGNQIIFTTGKNGVALGNIVSGAPYYILTVVGSNITVSSTPWGSAFVPISSAIGTLSGSAPYMTYVASTYVFGTQLTVSGTPSVGSVNGDGTYPVTFTLTGSTSVQSGKYYQVYNNNNNLYNGTFICTTATGSSSTITLTYPSNPGTWGTGTTSYIGIEATTSSSNSLGISKPLSISVTYSFRIGYQANSTAQIITNISTCRATGHDFLQIGTGGYNTSNYPNTIYGAPSIAAIQTNQVFEETVGRVFFVTTDENGVFKVGKFFTVDQGTGTVTFSASIALSNLSGLGFKTGVTINQFSADATMSDNLPTIVPVQSAIISYLDSRLGITKSGGPISPSNAIGPGLMALNGVTPMAANLNMNNNRVIGLSSPVNGTDSATKSYVDSNNYVSKLQDVNLGISGIATAVTSTGNYITLSTVAGINVGSTIVFSIVNPNPALGNITAGTTYYVTNVLYGSNQIVVSTTAPAPVGQSPISQPAFNPGTAPPAPITATGFTVAGGTATITFAAQVSAPFLQSSTITLSGFSPTNTTSPANSVNSSFVVTGCTTTQVTFSLQGSYTVSVLGTIASNITMTFVANNLSNASILVYDQSSGTATTTNTNNYITITANTNSTYSTLTVGDQITFVGNGLSSGGLVAGTYYITTVYGNLIQISSVVDGAVLALSSASAGSTVNWTSSRWRPISIPQGNNAIAITGASVSTGYATISFANQSTIPFPIGSTITVTGTNPVAYSGIYTVTGATIGSVTYAITTTPTSASSNPNTGNFGFVIGNTINLNYNGGLGSTLTTSTASGVLVDSMISTTANIQQSKILFNVPGSTYTTTIDGTVTNINPTGTSFNNTGVTTIAPTGTNSVIQAANGLASFDANIFTQNNGWVSLQTAGTSVTGYNQGSAYSITATGIPLNKIQLIAAGYLLGNTTGTAGNGASISPTPVTFNAAVKQGNGVTNDFFTSSSSVMVILTTGNDNINGVSTTGHTNVYGTIPYSTTHGNSTIQVSDSKGTVDITQLLIGGNSAIQSTGSSSMDFYAPFGAGGNGFASPVGGGGSTWKFMSVAGLNSSSGTVTFGAGGYLDVSSTTTMFVNSITAGNTTHIGSSATTGTASFSGQFSLQSGSTLIATYSGDLAEYYEGDAEYEVGTVVVFGGEKEITTTTQINDTRVAGVVGSTDKAAYVMYSDCPGLKNLVALAGRVPCKVVGRVKKGDMLTTSATPGYAVKALNPTLGAIIGKALEDKDYGEAGIIEVAVGRN